MVGGEKLSPPRLVRKRKKGKQNQSGGGAGLRNQEP